MSDHQPAESAESIVGQANSTPRTRAKRPLSRRRKVVFSLAALAIFLIASEAVLQIASWANASVAIFLSPNGHSHILPDARFATRLSPIWHEHDERVYRNERGIDRAEIVVIGDSQVYGSGVTREHAWPQLLAKRIGRSVYNMGVGGWDPVTELAHLEDGLSLHPQCAFVAIYTGNDFFDAYDAVYRRGLSPESKTTDANLLSEMAKWDRDHPFSPELEPGSTSNAGAGLFGLIWNHSKVIGLARGIGARVLFDWNDSLHKLETPATWEKALAETEGRDDCDAFVDGDFRMVFTPTYRLPVINTDDPRIREGIRLSAWSIGQMAAQFEKVGCITTVVLIPTKELVFRDRIFAKVNHPALPSYEVAIARENQCIDLLKAEFDRQGIQCIDVTAALADAASKPPYPYGIVKNGHPNAVGTAAIADRLAQEF